MLDILGDLDGVFADFAYGACDIHGRADYAVKTWDWYADWGMTDEEFWAPIKECDDFYGRYVHPYPWFDELKHLCKSGGRLVIYTANPLESRLASSKAEWIRNWIGPRVPVITLCAGEGFRAAELKAIGAGPNRILIDDSDPNIAKFRAAGGIGITFPQPWNENYDICDRRLAYVTECLSLYGKVAA